MVVNKTYLGIGLIIAGAIVAAGLYSVSRSGDDQVGQAGQQMISMPPEEPDALDGGNAGSEDLMQQGSPTQGASNGFASLEYAYEGQLTDVSGGSATGFAKAHFTNEADAGYRLYAVFQNLPDPEPGYFYEGWVVRRGGDMSVLSSGVAVKQGSAYVNTFTSSLNLTDHTFYVLTLEPDDGDPAPAEHILEGTMELTGELPEETNF